MINKDIVPLINAHSIIKRMFDMEDVFDELMFNIFNLKPVSTKSIVPVNFKEDVENYYIEIKAPGLNKDNISISVEDGCLEIKGDVSKENTKLDKNETYHIKEFSKVSFNRRIKIPEKADIEKIKASYDNGIINIVIPKSEKHKPRIIEIE